MRGRNLGSQTIMTNINFGPILAINYNVRLSVNGVVGL